MTGKPSRKLDHLGTEELAKAVKAEQAKADAAQRVAAYLQRQADKMRKELKRRKGAEKSCQT